MSEPQKKIEPTKSALPYVIVTNNEERLHTIHVPGSDGQELLSLLPGTNVIRDETLRACRTNKLFDAKFSEKIQKSVAPEAVSERVGQPVLVQGKNVPAKTPLSVMDDEEALALVKDATTEDVLHLFRAGEGRSEVRAAIDDQLKLLQTGGQQAEAG